MMQKTAGGEAVVLRRPSPGNGRKLFLVNASVRLRVPRHAAHLDAIGLRLWGVGRIGRNRRRNGDQQTCENGATEKLGNHIVSPDGCFYRLFAAG